MSECPKSGREEELFLEGLRYADVETCAPQYAAFMSHNVSSFPFALAYQDVVPLLIYQLLP
jgi:hypothetical protein